jgi:hypothetical protein
MDQTDPARDLDPLRSLRSSSWEASGVTVQANGPGLPRPRSATQCCADSLLLGRG